MRLSIVVSAIVAALIGFGSTIAIIIEAAKAVGADAAQTSSWVAALCLSMAATAGISACATGMPIVTAWSTPGAALIAASSGIGIHAAVGAFLVAGALIVLAAAFRPFGRLIETHPTRDRGRHAGRRAAPLRHGGVRERARRSPASSCRSSACFWWCGCSIRRSPLLAVLVVGLGARFGVRTGAALCRTRSLSVPHLHRTGLRAGGPARARRAALPRHDGLPEPARLRGSARLGLHPADRARSWPSPASPRCSARCFGAHTSNLAAISAAICTGPDTHPDPAKRWMVGSVLRLVLPALRGFSADLIARHRRPSAGADQDGGGSCADGRIRGRIWRRPSPTSPNAFRPS